MFAVIKTGGKQYKVAENDRFTVEKLAAEAGETIQFNEILMLGGDGDVTVGAPYVAGAAVQAEVVDQTRGPKVISFKKRRRKHGSQRKKGHRQHLTMVQVTAILAKGAEKSGVKAAIGARSAEAVAAVAPAAKPAKAATPKADATPKAEPKPKAEQKPKAKAKPKTAPKAAEAAGARPGNLLDAPKGAADDLKKISGVGPKLLSLLNDNGVYHFWQIAEWGPEEIAYMDDKLSFKGRIERDGWIEQAKTLAEEK